MVNESTTWLFIENTCYYRSRRHVVCKTFANSFVSYSNVDIEEGWLMRKYQLATLNLSTAGGNAEILLIDKTTAQQIMDNIKHSSLNISEELEVGE